jgi:hypothetical protein
VKSDKATPKPTALPVLPENIPDELKAERRWVVWKYTAKFDKKTGALVKWDKPPRSARTGEVCDATDPANLSRFEDALAKYQSGGYDGIGFVMHREEGYEGPGLVGIDLDKCRDPETGELLPWALEIVNNLCSYSELSPSETGVRIFVVGDIPVDGRNVRPVEVYKHDHYLTVTGQPIPGVRTSALIEDRADEIEAFYREHIGDGEGGEDCDYQPGQSVRNVGLTASAVLRIINTMKSPKWDRVRRLMSGDLATVNGDESVADAVVVEALVWMVGDDEERIDEVFRETALADDKWDRADYRRRTIALAMKGRKPDQFFKTTPQPPRIFAGAAAGESHDHKRAGIQCGPLALDPGRARQTAGGKITVPVTVLRGREIISHFTLTTAENSKKAARQTLRDLDEKVTDEDARGAVHALIACGAKSVLDGGQEASGPTVLQIVGEKIKPYLGLAYRTGRGLWSERRKAEVTRPDFLSLTPSWLLTECGQASDAPVDDRGIVKQSALTGLVEGALKIVWADLYEELPTASGAELNEKSEAGKLFRAAMIRLWTATRTFQMLKGDDVAVAAKTSLATRAKEQINPYMDPKKGLALSTRPKWQEVQRSCSAWWRVDQDGPGGQRRASLAMRFELTSQVQIDLPGVTDQSTLTELGTKYGCFVAAVPAAIDRKTYRLGVIEPGLTRELLSGPEDDDAD